MLGRGIGFCQLGLKLLHRLVEQGKFVVADTLDDKFHNAFLKQLPDLGEGLVVPVLDQDLKELRV